MASPAAQIVIIDITTLHVYGPYADNESAQRDAIKMRNCSRTTIVRTLRSPSTLASIVEAYNQINVPG